MSSNTQPGTASSDVGVPLLQDAPSTLIGTPILTPTTTVETQAAPLPLSEPIMAENTESIPPQDDVTQDAPKPAVTTPDATVEPLAETSTADDTEAVLTQAEPEASAATETATIPESEPAEISSRMSARRSPSPPPAPAPVVAMARPSTPTPSIINASAPAPTPVSNPEPNTWFKGVLFRLKSQQKTPAKNTQAKSSSPAAPAPKSTAEEETENGSNGMAPSAKDLYEGPPKYKCCLNWVEWPQRDSRLHQATAYETAGHALLLRHRRSHDVAKNPYWLHSVKVQSPLLKQALGAIMQNYPGFSADTEEVIFEAPFKSLFFRRSALKQAVEDLRRDDGEEGLSVQDEKLMQHLTLLDGVVADELAPTLKRHREMTSQGVISYDLAWTLFPPGSLVHSVQGPLDSEQVLRVKSEAFFEDKKKRMLVPCEYVDYDGEKFGWATTHLEIPTFMGTKSIMDLPAIPFGFHLNKDALEARLTERGRKWEGLTGLQCRAYEGLAVCPDEHRHVLGLTPTASVTGRIMVDATGYRAAVWWEQFPELEPLDSCEMVTNAEKHALTDAERLLCSPVVRGFSLAMKQWATFSVGSIREAEWSPKSWDRLILPGELKDTVLTLVDGQLRGDVSFNDFITGKGQGLVVLLHGPTGVGKTLTAESLSEHLKIPLFSLNPSDLGEDSRRAEKRLSELFRLALRWKSILLLDEAQEFLSRDIKGSKGGVVASVFLRSLEYHRGVIFLTTNRPELLDLAVLDRTHASLDYPELSVEAKTSIWENFVSMLGAPIEIEDSDRDDILRMQMNGRQTRDLIKVAALMASKRGDAPTKEDFVRAAAMVGAKALPPPTLGVDSSDLGVAEDVADAKVEDEEAIENIEDETPQSVPEPETASRLESIPETDIDTAEHEGGASLSEGRDIPAEVEPKIAELPDTKVDPETISVEVKEVITSMVHPETPAPAPESSPDSEIAEASPSIPEKEPFRPVIPERRSSIGSTSKPPSLHSAGKPDSVRSRTPTTPTRPTTSAGGGSPWPSISDAAIRVAQHRPPTPQQGSLHRPSTPHRPLTMPNLVMGTDTVVESVGMRRTSGESANTMDLKMAEKSAAVRRVSWKRPWAKVKAIR